jgi:ABC-type dipeptide/oligopeptide/nickel transport system ATPase subunit
MSVITKSATQESALQEILSWSAGRPNWQRDALRRIVENTNLTQGDVSELERICRAQHHIDTGDAPAIQCVFLTQAHLPSAPGATESVSLVSIGEIKNVNRLPAGQTVPLGAEVGLTIIYGENGAGKSGYARVIKKACRARGAQPIIRPNAFAPKVADKAEAKIVFRAGSTEVTLSWQDGIVADPRLANVFVFDASSASHYLGEEDAAAFTPYGLDVLPTLTRVCDAINERLKSEISQINLSLTRAKSGWKDHPETSVGKLIHGLSAATKVSDVDALASLDEMEIQRLQDLREAFKAEPLKKAKATRAAALRLDFFSKKVTNAAIDLADENMIILKKLLDNEKTATDAAKAFARGQFDSSFLAGTGGDMWRTLWEAAREYSIKAAYIEQPFPVITAEDRCVLCQQEIGDEAARRLTAFEKFATDKSQQLAANAAQLVIAEGNKLNVIGALAVELEKVDADLTELNVSQRTLTTEFVNAADKRLKLLKNSFSSKAWVSCPSLAASPESFIQDLRLALEARAKMEESMHDPETFKIVVAEVKELAAREWLHGVKADVLAQIKAYETIDKLKNCQKDVGTAQITTKSSDLTRQFVTDAFQQRFKSELKLLGLQTLDVALEPLKGKKGETKFGLRLVSSSTSKVIDIASEGEQRCIALAAFLSELSQASHQSALVFDDPVSSLDHRHRQEVANRLVIEAVHRQVIVFTHDVIFLNDLRAFAETNKVSENVLYLAWDNKAPGYCVAGLPWDSKKPNECLAELERDQKRINSTWNPQPSEENRREMRNAYSRLRSTLERVIEHEFLSGIVKRFESQVIAGRVKSLLGIREEECDEVKRLIDKCHSITDAHSPSMVSIPTPPEFLKDIADTKQLIEDVKQCKSKIKQATVGTP